MSWLHINSIGLDDHLILQVPLVDKSLIMNVYIVYNLPIFHPGLQKTFHYLWRLSSNGGYATISGSVMLTFVFT